MYILKLSTIGRLHEALWSRRHSKRGINHWIHWKIKPIIVLVLIPNQVSTCIICQKNLTPWYFADDFNSLIIIKTIIQAFLICSSTTYPSLCASLAPSLAASLPMRNWDIAGIAIICFILELLYFMRRVGVSLNTLHWPSARIHYQPRMATLDHHNILSRGRSIKGRTDSESADHIL